MQYQMMIDWLHYFRKIFDRKQSAEDGFSVLEALIAMAILSIALIPLLSLQRQFVKNVEGFERAEDRIHVRETALTYISSTNLTLLPKNELDLGPAFMSWSTNLAGQPQIVRGVNGVKGRFEIALYDVYISLDFDNGQKENFQVRGLGWRPISRFSP